jgi:hypothetical protein
MVPKRGNNHQRLGYLTSVTNPVIPPSKSVLNRKPVEEVSEVSLYYLRTSISIFQTNYDIKKFVSIFKNIKI